MIRQENIAPRWKSIPLSTCLHPRRVVENTRGDRREERGEAHALCYRYFLLRHDDGKLATPQTPRLGSTRTYFVAIDNDKMMPSTRIKKNEDCPSQEGLIKNAYNNSVFIKRNLIIII